MEGMFGRVLYRGGIALVFTLLLVTGVTGCAGQDKVAVQGPATSAVDTKRPIGPPATITCRPPNSAAASPSTGTITVHGLRLNAWAGEDSPTGGSSMVYDRERQRYRRIPYPAVPSPTGSEAAVLDEASARIGVMDVASGAVRWLSLGKPRLGVPQWSPDGTKLLVTLGDKAKGGFDFTLIDPRSLTVRTNWVSSEQYDLNRPLFTWHDNTHVVASVARRTGAGEAGPDLADHLQEFGLDGKPTRTLPVAGYVDAATNWSPDGRYVFAYQGYTLDGTPGRQYQLIDTTSGRVVAVLKGSTPGTAPVAWWVGSGQLIVRSDQSNSVIRLCLTTPHGATTKTWTVAVPKGIIEPSLILH